MKSLPFSNTVPKSKVHAILEVVTEMPFHTKGGAF